MKKFNLVKIIFLILSLLLLTTATQAATTTENIGVGLYSSDVAPNDAYFGYNLTINATKRIGNVTMATNSNPLRAIFVIGNTTNYTIVQNITVTHINSTHHIAQFGCTNNVNASQAFMILAGGNTSWNRYFNNTFTGTYPKYGGTYLTYQNYCNYLGGFSCSLPSTNQAYIIQSIQTCDEGTTEINFQGQTPSQGRTYFSNGSNTITANLTTNNLGGTVGLDLFLYNSTGSLLQRFYLQQSGDYNFTQLINVPNISGYSLNATAHNFTSAIVLDDSGNGRNLTAVNSPIINSSCGYNGNGFSAQSTNTAFFQRSTLGMINQTSDYQVNMSLKFVFTKDKSHYAIWMDTTSGNNRNGVVVKNSTAGELYFQNYNGSAYAGVYLNNFGVNYNNTWVNLSFTKIGTSRTIFLNGVNQSVTSGGDYQLGENHGFALSVNYTSGTNAFGSMEGCQDNVLVSNLTHSIAFWSFDNVSYPYNATSETRNFTVHNLTAGNITNPANNTGTTGQYLNITYDAATISPAAAPVSIANYTISVLNEDQSYNTTLNTTTALSYNWDVFASGLNPGTYWIRITSIDNYSNNVTTAHKFNITYDADLNMSFLNTLNLSLALNGSLNITDMNNSEFRILNTTTGNILAGIIKGHLYNITADFQQYAISNATYQANSTTHQYLNFSLYTNNSIYILIYDESTGFSITENVTIVITGTSETTYYTTNGTRYIDNLTDGTYTIKLSSTNYSLSQYIITVASRSTQILNAFLSTGSSPVTFSMLDFDSAASLPGVTFTQSRLINNTWTVIQSKISDITGRAQVNYLPNVKYQFVASLAGYTTELFYLDPVIFSTYNVRLHRESALDPSNTPDYQGLSVDFTPTDFYNNQSNTLYWIISAPNGDLTSYDLNITYPGGFLLDSGNNAYGESFTNNFNITGANLTNKVIISYCYDTTTSAEKCFSYKYAITGAYNNQSFIANKDNHYGMGELDRILIVTIVTLVISGIIFSVAGLMAGLPIALLILGYFYLTGFVSLWGVLPSFLIGMFILIGRTD